MEKKRTWDGRDVALEPPFGASVVVYRKTLTGIEYLLLHRAHHGPHYEGDWAWTPPSGARQPGETIDECAARELFEEAGIKASPERVSDSSVDWAVYVVETGSNTEVVLHDSEHDRFVWSRLEDALRLCQPDVVAASLVLAARRIGDPGLGH